MERISFAVLEGILAWSHWVSKCQCVQYCRIWTGKQPRRVRFLHVSSFSSCKGDLMAVEGSSLVFQAAFCYLTHWLKQTQYHGIWDFVGMVDVFCVHVFYCFFLVWVFLFFLKYQVLFYCPFSQPWWGWSWESLCCLSVKVSGSFCKIAPWYLLSRMENCHGKLSQCFWSLSYGKISEVFPRARWFWIIERGEVVGITNICYKMGL